MISISAPVGTIVGFGVAVGVGVGVEVGVGVGVGELDDEPTVQ